MSGASVLDELADIFLRRGAESYLGEAVTMSEHMCQTAQLAAADGAPEELVAACLLHDIGHYADEFSERAAEQDVDAYHEDAGAEMLARHFPAGVYEPVRLHVLAKRYLCAVERGYHDMLSPASQHSLALQGGPLGEEQARHFAALPHAEAAVRLRRYDDAGKVAGVRSPGFEHWRPLLERLLER